MTEQEMIELARQTELNPELWTYTDDLERFTKLVAQHERERIFSELFEMHLKAQRIHNHYLHAVMHIKAKDKARGET